jgi:hypothetical protein
VAYNQLTERNASINGRDGHPMVQDPQTAERPEMPAAAIAIARPDGVCSIEGIAAVLGERCAAGGLEARELVAQRAHARGGSSPAVESASVAPTVRP